MPPEDLCGLAPQVNPDAPVQSLFESIPLISRPGPLRGVRFAFHSAIDRIAGTSGAASNEAVAVRLRAVRADFLLPQPSASSNVPSSVPLNSAFKYHNSQ